MKRVLHYLFPHLHTWTVAWNDDDECVPCGAVKTWPGGVVYWPDYRRGE